MSTLAPLGRFELITVGFIEFKRIHIARAIHSKQDYELSLMHIVI